MSATINTPSSTTQRRDDGRVSANDTQAIDGSVGTRPPDGDSSQSDVDSNPSGTRSTRSGGSTGVAPRHGGDTPSGLGGASGSYAPRPGGFFSRFATSMRGLFRRGYNGGDFRADLMAGIVVGIVALPLSMALGIASGVPPEHGLYTAIVAGAVTALLGGAPLQVSGPTAAFVVLLAPVTERYGLGGLILASLMAGGLLLAMGLLRLGTLIRFVPYPVTLGFTGGIAVVIATLQLKDFFGLSIAKMPETYFGKVQALIGAAGTARWQDTLIGAVTLGTLIAWPRVTKKIPAPLVALSLATVLAVVLSQVMDGFSVATINSRFSYIVDGVRHMGVPRTIPMPTLKWFTQGPDGTALTLSWDLVRQLGPAALAISLLGAIESLLAAVVADGMAGTKHDSDAELVGIGMANIAAPFFGGFAATGAIARTATNIRSGARTPVACLLHTVFLLATMVLLAPLLGYLPMASLGALLLIMAWNMGEPRHLIRSMRTAPGGDRIVLAACLSLTVIFDMVVSVGAGVILATVLFARRMAQVADVKLFAEHDPQTRRPVPEGVALYEVAGPLFFGAAQRAMEALQAADEGIRSIVLDLHGVPMIDATGLVNLKGALDRLQQAKLNVCIVRPSVPGADVLAQAGIVPGDSLAIVGTRAEALALAAQSNQPA